MVIAGVLGLGLIPFALAEPIGKEVARLLGKLPEVTKKEKKKAKRQGRSVEGAVAAVLSRPVKLPLLYSATRACYKDIACNKLVTSL